MFKIKKYRIRFDVWGLVLFIIIMIPNFIWFAVPAENDILRKESITPVIDTVASIFQVIMIAALCVIANKQVHKPMNKAYFRGIVVAAFVYYISWCMYYLQIVHAMVILDLCIAPCIAFILFAIAKKNGVAFISAVVFLICHITYGVVNFIL